MKDRVDDNSFPYLVFFKAKGNVDLGDANTDTITFNGRVDSNVISMQTQHMI